MAEIFDPGSTFNALAARQRAGLAEARRRPPEGGSDRRAQASARDERAQDVRADRIQRERETRRFEAARSLQNQEGDRAFTRTIDERGNEIAAEAGRDDAQQAIRDQRAAQAVIERRQRLDEREAERDQAALQGRLDRENALEQIARAAFDRSLPRGSIVDIVA
ncbi:MAG: hypothetical protein WD407_07050 [Rhodospirillales bacterium]